MKLIEYVGGLMHLLANPVINYLFLEFSYTLFFGSTREVKDSRHIKRIGPSSIWWYRTANNIAREHEEMKNMYTSFGVPIKR